MYKPKTYRAKTVLKMQSEESLQKSICDYLKIQYPKIIFNSDMSGIKLTKGQAIKASKLRSNKGFPDIVIYEPRGEYHGLFIELKKEGEVLYKRNGEAVTEHVQEQINCINLLRAKGYCAGFAIGFNEAKTVIDSYFILE